MTSSGRRRIPTLPVGVCCRAVAACGALMLGVWVGCGPPSIESVGGYVGLYDLQPPPLSNPADMELAVGRRLRQFVSRGVTAKMQSDGRLRIAIPGGDEKDVEKAKRLVETPGVLQFRVLAKPTKDDEVIAAAQTQEKKPGQSESGQSESSDPPGAYGEPKSMWIRYDPAHVTLPSEAVTRQGQDSQSQVLVLNDSWNVADTDLVEVSRQVDSVGHASIYCTLSQEGAARMYELTSANVPNPKTDESRYLAVILDDHVITVPRIVTIMKTRFLITGSFSATDTEVLVSVLRAGRLPALVDRDTFQVEKVGPKR